MLHVNVNVGMIDKIGCKCKRNYLQNCYLVYGNTATKRKKNIIAIYKKV